MDPATGGREWFRQKAAKQYGGTSQDSPAASLDDLNFDTFLNENVWAGLLTGAGRIAAAMARPPWS